MKITQFGTDGLPLALGGWSTGVTSISSNAGVVGGLTGFVQRITSGGSNTLLGPVVNFAAGTGVSLSAASNTITITAGAASGTFLEVVGGGKGTVAALGNLGATETINVAAANYFWGTLNANCTIGFTGWTSGKDSQITVEVIEDGTGGWTPTFSGVTWLGGTTPTHDTTLGTTTIYVFFSRDGGTTIVGGQLGAGGALDPDDVRDAGRWEVAMVPGITAPPEPVETPDGTDWVYGWVT